MAREDNRLSLRNNAEKRFFFRMRNAAELEDARQPIIRISDAYSQVILSCEFLCSAL